MNRPISSEADPAAPAVVMAESGETVPFEMLEARSCRLARLLRRRGLAAGAHLAVLLDNHSRYLEVCWAAQRAGLLYTPINWHLGVEEAAYIVEDCGATALVSSGRFRELLEQMAPHLDAVLTRLAVDGDVPGFEGYDDAIADESPAPPEDQVEGAYMFYSSGTTGRPKGILPELTGSPFGTGNMFDQMVRGLYGFRPGMVYLCPAPLYHAAPLGWSMAAQRVGGTVVVMERFDAEAALRAIERYGVTHAQFVPTHFVRMLKLDDDVRGRYDLSSLEVAVHAAAPCPVEVKQQMLAWWGPIIHEYYSGSEGAGFCAVGADEWLQRPGTVGKPLLGAVHVTDDDGRELPSGEVGQLWFESEFTFEYHNDPEKTAGAYNDRGWSTLGDVGYVDDDGYVFLTDRVSHMIISGGVNIYPREIEDALVLHPGVTDIGVIGVPDAEMGESVLAVVQPADPEVDTDALAAELHAFCRARLAGFKCPRHFRFADDLPRLPTGKLLKRRLREQYGGSSASSVVGKGDDDAGR
jgi:long-chain acyl-CoA synthetase